MILKELRISRHISQEQLAQMSGLIFSVLNELVMREFRSISPGWARRLAERQLGRKL